MSDGKRIMQLERGYDELRTVNNRLLTENTMWKQLHDETQTAKEANFEAYHEVYMVLLNSRRDQNLITGVELAKALVAERNALLELLRDASDTASMYFGPGLRARIDAYLSRERTMSWIIMVEYCRVGVDPEFWGPFDKEEDAYDWLYVNPQPKDTEINVFPMEAPGEITVGCA
jgi:hypothetical protein